MRYRGLLATVAVSFSLFALADGVVEDVVSPLVHLFDNVADFSLGGSNEQA